MEIKSTYTNSFGQVLDVFYKDIENENDFKGKNIAGAHMFCFCKDKLVIVYADSKGYWGPVGGGVEKGESVKNAVIREIKEETNMKVIKQRFIGYREIFEPERIVCQVRAVCIVEPYGDFVNDPDGEVTEIKLIDPKDYKKYFDWGEIGARLMERALKAKAEMELEIKNA
jgi:8-oxo-dGTP diphosphatase